MYQKKMNKHIYGGEDNLSVIFERRNEFYGTDSRKKEDG